ncbi:phosphodiester glycosidase family protein [Pedobacter sp. SL55]|uniref:phosphodiester glycosidase family protein n=1 Tax=Pedobacter sp. SL55 TaxID=2995161 RepID=UPI00227003B6|nr:phosphodiester glycosidase family protein [Pedobacter sp. SL55]WAC41810.1 phosphodiester glycosidase family protein [Pedobacter sp. SL55]
MKFLIRIFLLTLVSGNIYAQNADSLVFTKAKWSKSSVAKKTKVYTYQFSDSSLFNANQYISFVEVKKHKKAPGFFIGYDKKELITTSAFAKKHKAIAAVNGTFFDIKNGGSVDFVKVNDTIINQNRQEKNNKRALHQQAAVVINDYLLAIKKWDGTDKWENNLSDKNIMLSGPLLLLDNQKEKLDSVTFNKLRHPRTAIGVKPNGSVLLLTVDGRQGNSAGMSLFELAKIMQWLGCTSAINLDGGGSTTLWAKDYGDNGVVNHPSDNKKWDHEGERKVANVIFIKGKP